MWRRRRWGGKWRSECERGVVVRRVAGDCNRFRGDHKVENENLGDYAKIYFSKSQQNSRMWDLQSSEIK